MREIDGVMRERIFLRSRRGSALPTAIIVMLLFMVLCAGMLALSRMNVSHVVFFERRNVLEQATLSLAQALADEIAEHASAWWAGDPAALGRGELGVDSGMGLDVPKMKFTYNVTPGNPDFYTLFVRGEYAGSTQDAAWGVSLDIYPQAPHQLMVRWSKPVQLDG
jgi:hypothetical protein